MSASFVAPDSVAVSPAAGSPEGRPGWLGNIADLLLRAAGQHPRTGISFLGSLEEETTFLSHPALLHEARCILSGLRFSQRPPGTKVVLLLEHAHDFICAYWACVLGGYLPCPLLPIRDDVERRSRSLQHVKTLLGEPLLVTTRALQEQLQLDEPAELETLRTASPASWLYDAGSEEPATLMLTSGSTGSSKAVVLTHANLLASMRSKAQRQQMTPEDITLNWVSFDHVAALLEVHLISLYVGATQYHLEAALILADPLLFLRILHRHRICLTFAPNFLLGQINNSLSSEAPATPPPVLDLSCVRCIVSGGEANVVDTGRRFLDLLGPHGLPYSALHPAFGMTETCAGSIYSSDFPHADAAQEFASVGQPVDGLEMRIADDTGASCTDAGELQLRGPMIFGGYYNDEAATRAAFTPDGWFKTGDLGHIENGRLTLVGRSKDSIIVNGVSYFSQDLEAVLGRLEGIEPAFVAVFPMRPQGAHTEQLVVAFASNIAAGDDVRLQQLAVAIRNTTILWWGFRPALILELPKESFPKTSLGKIQRSLMRKRLEANEYDTHAQHLAALMSRQRGAYEAPNGATESTVAGIYAEVLGLERDSVGAYANFFDLGGTSLNILKLKRTTEKRFSLPDLPVATILQNPTVRALAARIVAATGDELEQYDPLVPLQMTGGKVPLFCIHPGTGEILVFVSLANYFVNDRPFYALRARGFNKGEAYFASMQELVTSYVEAIRRRQPQGPYALAGYSFGAPVAFEIAKVLEAQGERIAFLASIDGAPYIGERTRRLDYVACTVTVSFFLSLIDKRQMLELPGKIRAVGEDPCACILQAASRERLAELNLDLPKFQAWAALAYSLALIGEPYEPTGTVAASATVFYAEPLHGTKREWLNDHLLVWDRLTRIPNSYIEVSGEHNSLLEPKHVATFQALLRAQIDRALGGR